MNRKKRPNGNHAIRKKAFDHVIKMIRERGEPMICPCHGLDPAHNSGGGKGGNKKAVYPTLATHSEFHATVSIAARAALPKDISFDRFKEVYFANYSDDYIECEKFAQDKLGDRRHSVEQRVGAEFIKRGIFKARER